MIKELEKLTVEKALSEIADCDPAKAELILDSVQSNIMDGVKIGFQKVLELVENCNQWEIKDELKTAIIDIDRFQILLAKKYGAA